MVLKIILYFSQCTYILKKIAGVGRGLYGERINSNTASNDSITPELSHYGTKARAEFSESCLTEDKAT